MRDLLEKNEPPSRTDMPVLTKFMPWPYISKNSNNSCPKLALDSMSGGSFGCSTFALRPRFFFFFLRNAGLAASS